MALIVCMNVEAEVTYPFIYLLRRHSYRENNSQEWIHSDNRKLPPAPSRCGSQNPHIHKDARGKLAEYVETLRHGMHIETNKVPPIYLTMQRVDAQVM